MYPLNLSDLQAKLELLRLEKDLCAMSATVKRKVMNLDLDDVAVGDCHFVAAKCFIHYSLLEFFVEAKEATAANPIPASISNGATNPVYYVGIGSANVGSRINIMMLIARENNDFDFILNNRDNGMSSDSITVSHDDIVTLRGSTTLDYVKSSEICHRVATTIIQFLRGRKTDPSPADPDTPQLHTPEREVVLREFLYE